VEQKNTELENPSVDSRIGIDLISIIFFGALTFIISPAIFFTWSKQIAVFAFLISLATTCFSAIHLFKNCGINSEETEKH